MTASTVPSSIQHLEGRIIDADSHEMIPLQGWAREHGAFIQPFADLYAGIRTPDPRVPNNMNIPDFPGDVAPIDDSIWDFAGRGSIAPGSVDMARRAEVLDAMGLAQQIIFPSSAGLFGTLLKTGHRFRGFQDKIDDESANDPVFIGQLFDAHNQWAVRTQKLSDRLVPVGILQGEDPDDVLRRARGLMDEGIRALTFIPAVLLGGESPAHDCHDALWAEMERRGVFGVCHLGGDGTFLATDKWLDAPYFAGYKHALEVNLNPWSLSTVHLAVQNWLGTMILGGVFERFPGLMFGVMELAAHWVGPMAESLDMWMKAGGLYRLPEAVVLPELPSTYIRRNIRVSPFDFEPIDTYITRYDLGDVLCYASDFPHVEGGRTPMHDMAARIEPLGDEALEKFFCTNAGRLLGAG